MKTYRIFLASSAELQHERDLVTAAIADFVSLHPEHKVNFQVIKWENFASTFDDARKQDAYNDSIPTCDIFLMLFWTKVGKYTFEEYEIAAESLKANKKPLLLLLEKLDGSDKEASVSDFKKRVSHGNGLFSGTFKDDDTLKANIKEELQKLFKDGLLKKGEPATLLSPNGPAEPAVFLGRENELKEIRKRLDTGGKLMLINAEGGIGKTTLAAKYWHESLQNYKHNAWLFCEGGITNSLKELAPKLNVDLSNFTTEAEQVQAIKHALSQVHDDFLLVLDNANDEDDILAFKQEFEGFHWHVLFTSRCETALGEQTYKIEHLPPPLAKELFIRYYNEPSKPDFEEQVEKLTKALNYHTLLIEVFAKNIHEAKGITSMQEFIEKLETEGLFIGEDSFEIKANYAKQHLNNEKASTDDILAALYDFSHLAETEDLRAALVAFAVLPAENYDVEFLFTLITNLEKADKIKYKKQLNTLNSKGWISQTNDEYRISPVIQKLVLDKHKESLASDAQALLDKLNELLENDAYNLTKLSLPAAQAYVKLVEHITKSLKENPSLDIASLNFAAGVYNSNTGDMVSEKKSWQNYKTTYQNLLRIEPENLSFKNGLAISYEKLGGIYEQTGDWKNALINYEELQKLYREVFESSPENLSYKNGLAISYEKLGGIYEQTGDWKNALIKYEEYFRISKEIYESNPENLSYKNGLAISYEKLGGIYEQTGDWKNALIKYEEYFRISKEIYESSPENLSYKNGLAISYEKLGGIYEQTGDWKNALINYEERNKIGKEIYESNPENLSYKNGLAISYEKLGGIYEQTGDWKNALINYEEDFRITKEIYESNPENLSYKNGLAISYEKLGGIYEQTGDWKNALLNYQECNRFAKESSESSPENLSYKNELAISYYKLGHLYEKVEKNKAIENLEFSVSLYQELVNAAPEIVEFSRNYGIIKEYLEELKNGK
jgi:tetratricopeptide (TPR) repeat protein